MFKQEISWSSYKKVPILLVQSNNGYLPLNDSSMIISVLSSFLNDNSVSLSDLLKYYSVFTVRNNEGRVNEEIINKYFLMYQNVPKNKKFTDVV